MKPAPFTYHAPATTGQALDVLGELGPDARVLAGGQSLLPAMNARRIRPRHLVDIGRVRGLDYVCRGDGRIAIGARARQAVVERAEVAVEHAPLLVEALRHVGTPPIRHRGTVVGSLAHAHPAAQLPAVALALDARVTVLHSRGERVVGVQDLFRGPCETSLRPGELIGEVSVPVVDPHTGCAYAQLRRRAGAPPVVGAAVLARVRDGVVDRLAIGLCGVAPTPVRARAGEELLLGERPTTEAIEATADWAVAGLDPPSDVHGGAAYRCRAARSCIHRALARAVERARQART